MTDRLGQIHEVTASEALHLLGSSPSGLSHAEAQSRLATLGRNELDTRANWRWLSSLARHFFNLFSLLLDVAAATCFLAEWLQPGEGMRLLGCALLTVSLLNALFAFAQEMRAEHAMEELRKFLPLETFVLRAGREQTLPVVEVTVGDLVRLTEGARIPADIRLTEANDLLVNNAPLTGEARSQQLTAEPTSGGRLADSPNVALAGCSVLRGGGLGVVFATGHRTEFGRIAALSRDIRRPPSPLEYETARMIRVLTIVAVILGSLFFAYGVAIGRSWWINLVFMLGIIVANVPEGLLPTLTLALSMASLRMARKNVLVRSLEAVEALGCVQVICTDKTGTLTRNELRYAAALDSCTGMPVEDFGREREILTTALVASEVRPLPAESSAVPTAANPHPHAAWTGDPIDVAVAVAYEQRYGSSAAVVARTLRHVPFDLHQRREAGVYDDGQQAYFAVKGAWESLRPLIGQAFDQASAQLQPVDEQRLCEVDAAVRNAASDGRRILAVARRPLANSALVVSDVVTQQSLVLCGLLALEDPVRQEAPAAVAQCRAAGIRVILVTGDHPDTAEAVARQCGILAADGDARTPTVLGSELALLRERQLAERLANGAVVFARTTPEQKVNLIAALKRCGAIVAMTGDGVNDAAALKAADVGIAMGCSGTDVAREAADIVLLDDNFASIVAGIEEGRGLFANMQKFTTYVLASNVPEIVPFLAYVALPVPLALTVVQILSIDLGTDLLPAIGLGQEPPESDVMQRPPRSAEERLLSSSVMTTAYLFLGVLQAAWAMAMFFSVLVAGGWQWGTDLSASDPLYRSATGATLASVVVLQIANVVGRRTRRTSGLDRGLAKNYLVLAGIALEAAFVVGLIAWKPLQDFLGTGPLSGSTVAVLLLGAPLLLALDVGRKRLLGRHLRSVA